MEVRRMKMKICLVGEAAVGKTSLIRRFVLDDFDDKYIQTLGTKVSKKELSLANPVGGSELKVDMTIWDIMGQKGFRELLKEAYFYGAKGIIAVCDVTRRSTLDDLDDWIEGVYSVTGRIPIHLSILQARRRARTSSRVSRAWRSESRRNGSLGPWSSQRNRRPDSRHFGRGSSRDEFYHTHESRRLRSIGCFFTGEISGRFSKKITGRRFIYSIQRVRFSSPANECVVYDGPSEDEGKGVPCRGGRRREDLSHTPVHSRP